MAQEMVVGKMLLDLIPIANNAVSESEVVRHFTKIITDYFGVEKVSLSNVYEGNNQKNALLDYVLNTRKTYIDNQLSEFSSFPELIGYRNSGYRSCALMPLLADGKVVAVLEMLSSNENKFSEELMNNVSFGASLIGFALMYKYESGRSAKLASYFDGAFNSNIPQFLISSTGAVVKANRSAVKEFGYDSQGGTLKSVVNLDMSQLASGSAKTAISRQNGLRIYNVTASQVSEKLMHVSVQDVTDLERFRTMLELMNDSEYSGVVHLDGNLSITDVTENIKGIMGYQSSLLLGKSIIDIVSEGERVELKDKLSAMQQHVSGYLDLINADSAPTRIRYVASRLPDGYLLLFSNARAEQYITDIRAALADFIDSTSDMVMLVNELGYIKSANVPASAVLGYSREHLSGKNVRDFYADPSILDRDLAYIRKGGKVDNSYVDFLANNSVKVPATHSVRSFKEVDGNFSYIIVAKELATKRRLEEQESAIRKLNTEVGNMASTSELKSQFIYNITHELKTPLTNINGFSKLLYEGSVGPLNAEQKDYLSTIIDEVERLVNMIGQVLDAAKLDSNKVKLDLKEVDLKELASNPSIRSLQESAANKRLSFKWSVEYDVPKITADPNRLIQIFVNLVGNAIKFTDKGSIDVKIRKKSKRTLECNIIDTGIGISDDAKRQLFRKFYQAPKRELVKQEQAGTGLGLSITKGLVSLHGGKIGFESPVPGTGKGSRFWFTLPVSPRKKRQQQTAAQQTQAQAS